MEFGVRMAGVWIPALPSTGFATLGSCSFHKEKTGAWWGVTGMEHVEYLTAGHLDAAQKMLLPFLLSCNVQADLDG